MTTILWSPTQWQNRFPSANNLNVMIALKKIFDAKTMYDRFDALTNLISACQKIQGNTATSEAYQRLATQARQFAAAIVDAKNNDELQQKIALREKYKNIDPNYMPWHTPNSRTDVTKQESRKAYLSTAFKQITRQIKSKALIRPIDDAIETDMEHSVTYLAGDEKEPYRVFVHEGKFKEIILSPNGENLALTNFDTKKFGKENEAIFIISAKGEMFALPSSDSRFHHTSALAGSPVFFPGIFTVTNGNLQKLANNSGHYMPPSLQLIRTMAFLRKTGVLDKKSAAKVWDDNFTALKEVSNNPQYRMLDLGISKLTSALSSDQQTKTLPLLEAAQQNDFEKIENLLHEETDLGQTDDYNRTALSIAVLEGFQETVNLLLPRMSKETINIQDHTGMTALLFAISANNKQIVKQLLEKGADANLATNDGLTPLALAAWANNASIFRALLRGGANPQVKSEQIIASALQQQNLEIMTILTDPQYHIEFDTAINNAVNASDYAQVLLLLTSLSSEYQYGTETLELLKNETSNFCSELITFLNDMPEEKRQDMINTVLGEANALGKLLNENESSKALLLKRLNNNDYEQHVKIFNETSATLKIIAPTSEAPLSPVHATPQHQRKKTAIVNVADHEGKNRTLNNR